MRKAFSYIIVFFIFGFLVWNIRNNWETVSTMKWDFNSTNTLWFLIFLLLVYLVNVISWHLIVKALGAKVGLKKNLKIWIFSNIMRLIPGGIWQYPSRIYLLSQEGVPKTLGATAVLAEVLFTLSLGAAVVFTSFAFWQLPTKFATYREALWIFLIVPLLVILLLTNQRVVNKAVVLIGKFKPQKRGVLGDINIPPARLPVLITAFLSRFLVIGVALFFLARLVIPIDFSLLPVFIGAFSLSWLLGYIALLAPAGLGVTEVSLAALLSLYIPFPVAVVLAIAFRVALVGTEIMFLFVAFLFVKDNN